MSTETLRDTPPVLYPVVPQAVYSRCSYCWQPGPSAMCRDPFGEGLRRLCGGCGRALRTGRAPELTDDQLTEAWPWLARHYINERAGLKTGVTEAHIDWALAALTPVWMPPQVGWERFEGLCEDLLTLQEAEGPCAVLDVATTGPDHDPETYVNDLRGLVDDAVHKLIGRPA